MREAKIYLAKFIANIQAYNPDQKSSYWEESVALKLKKGL